MKSIHCSYVLILVIAIAFVFSACDKDEPDPTPISSTDPDPTGPALVFKFEFDPDAPRLNNVGQPAEMQENHAGQSPTFNKISAHYIELAPGALTQLGAGEVLYKGPETTTGGDLALDFDQAIVKSGGEEFIRIPFSSIEAGTYEWIRVSLAYQNYDIEYVFAGQDYTGTVASFIGYNNFITSYEIKNETMEVNDDKLQGYWGFETTIPTWGTETSWGQAPAGATTVPNPLFDSSPIEPGSCVVTGDFNQALEITGNETEDIVVVLSLSTNNSFEWIDGNGDGLYEPLDESFQPTGEFPVDMGVRGLEAIVLE